MALHRAPKIRPAARTEKEVRYHIDFTWWERANRELRVYLHSHLCREHQQMFVDFGSQDEVDWIDPHTAEVRRVDGLEHTLHTHCSLQPDYITPSMSIVNALFRVFLASGNTPLTIQELATRIGRPSETVESVLAGPTVYKGIVPVHEEGEVEPAS